MLGLYIIAFLAPLVVFGSFGYIIQRLETENKGVFNDNKRAMFLFVWLPLGISYGLIVLSAAIVFIRYVLTL